MRRSSFVVVLAAILAGTWAFFYFAYDYYCDNASSSGTSFCQSINSGNLSFLTGNGTYGKYFYIGAFAAIVALVIWGL